MATIWPARSVPAAVADSIRGVPPSLPPRALRRGGDPFAGRIRGPPSNVRPDQAETRARCAGRRQTRSWWRPWLGSVYEQARLAAGTTFEPGARAADFGLCRRLAPRRAGAL